MSGEIITVYRSSDGGSTWDINAPDTSCTVDDNLLCVFQTNHLTTFTFFGVLSTFNIANSDAYTKTASVTLNNSVSQAQTMRFSNNGSTYLPSTGATYAATYAWTMTALAANS